MKHKVQVWLTLLLCLLMAIPAYADAPVLVADNLTEHLSWVDGTSLLRVPGSDGYSMNTLDGTALTEPLYSNFFNLNGYIEAAKVDIDSYNCWGAFDTSGNVLIPFAYGDINVLSRDWALGIVLEDATADSYDYSSWTDSDKFYNIARVDVYHMPEGNKVAELPRANYLDSYAVYDCLNIQNRADNVITTYDANFNVLGTVEHLYDSTFATPDYTTFRENGQYGIKDAAGNVIMAPSFYSVYDFRYGYAEVSDGESSGLVDTNGQVAVPVEYSDILISYYAPWSEAGETSAYNCCGYFGVVNAEEKVGYVNAAGEVTCEPKYSRDIVTYNGASLTLVDLEGNTRLLAADGVETTLNGYSDVYVLHYSNGMYYRVTDANTSLYGVIDWHGEVVLPCEYTSVTLSGDGQYLLACKDWENYSIYQVSYPGQASAAEPPVAESATEPEASGADVKAALTDKVKDIAGAQDAEETTEAEAGAPAASDAGDVVSVINSAITLLNTDAASNSAAAISLLQNARSMLKEDRPDLTPTLNAAITLLNEDAAANRAGVVTLLNSVLLMLK